MGRIVLVLTIAIVATVGTAAWMLVGPSPSSGAGWRVDPGASWPPAPADLASTVVPYAPGAEDDIGLGVTVYGSSSCPPRLRGVHIGEREVVVDATRGPIFGACTSDAVPHSFGIAVNRGGLPALPFEVVVRTDDRDDRVTIPRLP